MKVTFLKTTGKAKVIFSQKARYIDTTFVQSRATVIDSGPILNRLWVNVSCLLG